MLPYQLFQAGYCMHCQRITLQGGRFKKVAYPALCSLIRHPTHGSVLFDTGYSQHFDDASARFPEKFYQWITPVTQTLSLKEQLKQQRIDAESIRYIVISHFHSDHISALKDFPNAQFICHPSAWQSVKSLGRFRGLLNAFMPDLLPNDFKQRLILLKEKQRVALPKSMAPFQTGYDLFNERDLFAINLPGHAAGHIGLYFTDHQQTPTFFIGDSCWHQETFQELRYPSRLTHLIHHDVKQYKHTIAKLHELYKNNPSLNIIPSHCAHFADAFSDKN